MKWVAIALALLLASCVQEDSEPPLPPPDPILPSDVLKTEAAAIGLARDSCGKVYGPDGVPAFWRVRLTGDLWLLDSESYGELWSVAFSKQYGTKRGECSLTVFR